MMTAYLAIKYHPDQQNRPRIEQVSAALRQVGLDSVCVVRDLEQWGWVHFAPAELMARSLAELDRCQMVVVELTEKGVGVGLEAGYAWAKQRPIITIAQLGADISITLQGISRHCLWYATGSDLAKQLAPVVQSLLNEGQGVDYADN